MKRLMFATMLALAGVCIAADAVDTNKLAKAERRRIRREQRIARDGGLVLKPNLGKVVRFIDAQGRVARGDVESAAKTVGEVINMPVVTTGGDASAGAFKLAEAVMKEKSAGAAVLIGEEDGLPAIIVAPEKSWAVVTVTALAGDFPPKDALAVRAGLLARRLQRVVDDVLGGEVA